MPFWSITNEQDNVMEQDLYYIVIIATFVFFFLTFFIIYIGVFHNRKKIHYQQELLKTQIEIKEQTLQHIAYELHDNLGQVASLIKINLNTIQIDDRQNAKLKIEDTKELVRQLILDLKSISKSLNSEWIAQMGITKALSREVDQLNKMGSYDATFDYNGFVIDLDANTTTLLYRMVQEIINNMVKHSRGNQFSIQLTVNDNLVKLACRDNGVGFNMGDISNNEGSGLLNLHSRAKLINAKVSIRSQPGSGTEILIELPI